MLYEVDAGILLTASRVIEAASEEEAREIAEDMVGAGQWAFENEGLAFLETIGEGRDGIEFYSDNRPHYFIRPRLSKKVKCDLVRERCRLAYEQDDVLAGASFQAGFMMAMAYLGHDRQWIADMNAELSDLMDAYTDSGYWQ